MRARGDLKRGQVGDLKRAVSRGDLMKWVPTEASQQPACLRKFLSALDSLVEKLQSSDELLAGEGFLGKAPLVRHEIQATCYPCNGAGYARHIDDQTGSRARVLTAILYLNPGWAASHGGALRVYPKDSDGSMGFGDGEDAWRGFDVEPVDKRLICFWSDPRVPHEVLAARADRFAISVWYGDAKAARLPRH